jgi:hypothetical protein
LDRPSGAWFVATQTIAQNPKVSDIRLNAEEREQTAFVNSWSGFWFWTARRRSPANCQLPIALCTLAGKDAGPNNTKMLRGLNAEC